MTVEDRRDVPAESSISVEVRIYNRRLTLQIPCLKCFDIYPKRTEVCRNRRRFVGFVRRARRIFVGWNGDVKYDFEMNAAKSKCIPTRLRILLLTYLCIARGTRPRVLLEDIECWESTSRVTFCTKHCTNNSRAIRTSRLRHILARSVS